MTGVVHLKVKIDASCGAHPLLAPKYVGNLPAVDSVTLTPPKFFGYAMMKFQDAGRADTQSYNVVRAKAASLQDVYSTYLTFDASGLSVQADTETTGTVSEFVGIAAGLAAASKVFRVNPNRFSRILPPPNSKRSKRMDYEFVAAGKRFLLEVRGTKSSSTQKSMIADVAPKKSAPASIGFAAHAGCVSLYNNGADDHVAVIDPPAEGGDASFGDELAIILDHYHNILRLTHASDGMRRWIRSWLKKFRSVGAFDETLSPPEPTHLSARLVEPIEGVGPVEGTYFDRRVSERSVQRFRTFDEATERASAPTWFVGLRPEVPAMLAAGRWRDLVAYQAPDTSDDATETNSSILLSDGLVVAPVQLDDRFVGPLRAEFSARRARYERALRDLGEQQ
jgi:hypothetical protein